MRRVTVWTYDGVFTYEGVAIVHPEDTGELVLKDADRCPIVIFPRKEWRRVEIARGK